MTTPQATTPTPLPILLVHKSRTHARRLDQVVEILQREDRDHLRVGVVASLANTSPAQARAFLGRFNTLFTMLDLRLVDPAIAAHRDQLGTNPKLPHLQGPWPATPNPRRIRAVLNLQRELGATALLTPTGLVRDTDAD